MLSVNNNETADVNNMQGQMPSLGSLLKRLLSGMEEDIEKLGRVLEAPNVERNRQVTSFLSSTGGRPAYDITKAQIEQLRDTGMNWKSIADFVGVSERTLHWRRVDYGIEASFTDINTDGDLDYQIRDILRLTPYSGESYSIAQKRIAMCPPMVITIMALRQLLNLGTGCTVTHCEDCIVRVCIYVYIYINIYIYIYIYGSILVNEMPKSARYHIDRANSIVLTSKRLPLQPVSSERNHQVVQRNPRGLPLQPVSSERNHQVVRGII